MAGTKSTNNQITDKMRADCLYAFLVKGTSYRKIEEECFEMKAKTNGGGFVAQKIVRDFGLSGDKKGIFKNEEINYDKINDSNIRNALKFISENSDLLGDVDNKDTVKTDDTSESATRMKWTKLLSEERPTGSTSRKKGGNITAFEDDYLSIVSSQAFRRLQDKTQVFLLDKSDFVRTRLTHSLEVSTIARQLAVMIIQMLKSSKDEKIRKEISDLIKKVPLFEDKVSTIVACAGLLHDTGNPPFGHYGEDVIRKWFDKQFSSDDLKLHDKPVRHILNKQMKADFTHYEGNAQGLRIISKSRLYEKASHDVDLTYAVMNTLVKYPNPSHEFDSSDSDIKKHKNGFYYAEKDIMRDMCEATGTFINGEYYRHPLVFVMEAADDIAYRTADLEDAVVKRCFTVDEFIKTFKKKAEEMISAVIVEFRDDQDDSIKSVIDEYKRLREVIVAEKTKDNHVDEEKIEKCEKKQKEIFKNEISVYADLSEQVKDRESSIDQVNKLEKRLASIERSYDKDFVVFENWLSDTREWLMEEVAKSFANPANYKNIMEGSFKEELYKEGTCAKYTMDIFGEIMKEYVYDSDELVEAELAAKQVLESLLKNFVDAALYFDEVDKDGKKDAFMTEIDKKFMCKVPANFKRDYLMIKQKIEGDEETKEREKLYFRLMMVMDYISGMTDSYATNLYKVINGIL